MDTDYELSSEACPKCGSETRARDCTGVECDEGWYHDCGEDSCACARPAPNRRCDECAGHGRLHWCPTCGWDLLQKHFLNGHDARETKTT